MKGLANRYFPIREHSSTVKWNELLIYNMKESQMHFLKEQSAVLVKRKGQQTLNKRCRKLHSDKPYKITQERNEMGSAEDVTKIGQLEEQGPISSHILQGVDPSVWSKGIPGRAKKAQSARISLRTP